MRQGRYCLVPTIEKILKNSNPPHPAFYVHAGDRSSGSHASFLGPLATPPSPQDLVHSPSPPLYLLEVVSHSVALAGLELTEICLLLL